MKQCVIFKDISPGLPRSWNFREKNPDLSRRHRNPAKNCWYSFLTSGEICYVYVLPVGVTAQTVSRASHSYKWIATNTWWLVSFVITSTSFIECANCLSFTVLLNSERYNKRFHW